MASANMTHIRIKEIGRIITGGTPPIKAEYFGNEYPFIKPTDIDTVTWRVEDTEVKLSQKGYDYSKRRLLPPDTTCVTLKATVGKICITTRNSFTNDQFTSVVPERNRFDPIYVYYLLRATIPKIKKIDAGSASGRDHVKKSAFESIEVEVHDLHQQRKIAVILSAYDNLIENNRRRIQLIEEMARALYREWFVHFRFPGHEDVEMVDSEMGEIPESWEVKKIDDAFEILGGGTPSTKTEEYWENGYINWYTPSDLTKAGSMFIEESSRKITKVGLKKSSAKMFPAQCVMMTSRATLGVVSINTAPASTNQGFITCIPNDRVSMFQILFWIKDNVNHIISLGTGTTYKEIAKSVFREMKFVLPPKEFKDEFEKVVSPMGQLILNLQRINSALSEARDLLLPRLVSGRIDVSNMEI